MTKNLHFIIIGSTGRNTGKTEFICKLIKNHSIRNKIIGVKVTTIDRNEKICHRGLDGCGVCNSFTGDYEITEETNYSSKKDTSRMMQAGAYKTFWLKVDKKKLQKGLDALLQIIPQNTLIVCESNSIRKVLEPSLFIVIKNKKDNTIKESCAKVIDYANKIIEFSDLEWNFSPDRIITGQNQWMIKEKATAIILAGGKSTRMGGKEKSLLLIHGEPLISTIVKQLEPYFDELIIGANDVDKFKFLNCKIIPDIEKNKGPLMGIFSCLKASGNEVNFVTACDIPVMNIRLIQKMINLSDNVDIVMPMKKKDHYEPLFAIYKKNIIPNAEKIMKNNGRRIIELFNYVKTRFVELNDTEWYLNINLTEDYHKYINKNIP